MSTLVINSLFYLFAVISILLALGVVISPKILRAAVYLMGVLVVSAGFYLLLGAEFLAGVQILVYVGGIVVLLIFAVMLTHSVDLVENKPSLSRRIFSYLASLAFFIFGSSFLIASIRDFPRPETNPLPTNTTAAMGQKLLDSGPTGYLLPFELISFLLLASLIGGIVIARRQTPQNKERS